MATSSTDMTQGKSPAGLRQAMKSWHAWVVVSTFILFSLVIYSTAISPALLISPSRWLGLSEPLLDRCLLMAPALYANRVFGFRAGVILALMALFVMLPQALLEGPGMRDGAFQSILVFVSGVAVSFILFRWREMEKRHRAVVNRLETVQDQLQANVRLARASEIRLATLNRISGMLTQSLDFKQVLRTAIDTTMEVMQVEVALIFSLSQDMRELNLVAHEGVSVDFAEAAERLLLAEGPMAEVVRTGQILFLEDASQDPRIILAGTRKMRLQSMLIVPLKFKGASVGVVCLAMRRPRQFLSEDVELATVIANQIGAAMENARLYEEQRRIAQQLAVSEGNYRSLFEKAHDAIWVHDLDGTIVAANEADARLTRLTTDRIIGRNATEFMSPESLELAKEVRQKLLSGETFPQPYEQKIIRGDKTEAFVMLTSSLIARDGHPFGFQHIARDVTEEKRMQENLKHYVRQITRAQEEERKRIARELHDETSQSLYATLRHLDNFLRDNKSFPDPVTRFIRGLREDIIAIQSGVRRFSQDLRPSIIDDLGLLPSIQWLSREMEKNYGIYTDLKVTGSERRFSPETELLLFRTIQEALQNVAKHAMATTAEVAIEFDVCRTVIRISDNGKGFSPPHTIGDLSRSGKLGLIGMQERTSLLGGQLTIESVEGKGTTVSVVVPG